MEANCITSFHKWCIRFGILPTHKIGGTPTAPSWWFKGYVIFTIVCIIMSFCYSMHGRAVHLFPLLPLTSVALVVICSVLLVVFNVMIRILFVFINFKDFQLLFNKCYQTAMQIQHGAEDIIAQSHKKKVILFHLYMFYLSILAAILYLNGTDLDTLSYFSVEAVFLYFFNLTILIMFQAVSIIYGLFDSVNKLLETVGTSLLLAEANGVVRRASNGPKSLSSTFKTRYTCDSLKNIGREYSNLCDIIDLYNRTFGLVILYIVITVILYTLQLIVFTVCWTSLDIRIDDVKANGPEVIVINLSWIALLLVSVPRPPPPLTAPFQTLITLLAVTCQRCTYEGRRFLKICFHFLNIVPGASDKTNVDLPMRQVLNGLVLQATARKPTFSAAGFFTIDCRILGFIIGNVTSYVIVAFQFIK